MQSDTIIGIVGAVVLVAVMVGVFAYEYNNAPEPEPIGQGPDSMAGKMAAFNATYPGLDAAQDLDGDGIPNYDDDDLDGDGDANAGDDDIAVHKTFTGNVAARTPQSNPASTANQFFIGSGHMGGTITVNWGTTAGPIGGAIDELVVTVTGPGDVTCDNTADGKAVCDLAAAVTGVYTIEVRHASPAAQAKAFTGDYHIQY